MVPRGEDTGSPAPGIDLYGDQGGSLVRHACLLLGGSAFAYLLGVAVHEVGHFLANTALGVPESRIVLHPFDLSQTIEVGDVSSAFGTAWRRAVAGGSGPLLNVAVGVTIGLVLWRRRSPRLFPFLLLAPVALLQEGVGLIIGLVDYPDVGSDWVLVMQAGASPLLIGMLAVLFLGAGYVWVQLLIPLLGLSSEDPRRRLLAVLPVGIPVLLLGAVVYLSLLGSDSGTATRYVLQNRAIALGSSLALVGSIIVLYRPLFPVLDRICHTPPAHVSSKDAVLAIVLGLAVCVAQLAFFN